MKEKSLKKNAILNLIKTLMSVIFPLISFPYASRTLQVHALGNYNFSFSLISYFALIAALGISTYSIREGARLKDSPKQLHQFASEVYSINIYSTVISYMLMFCCIFMVTRLQSYKVLLLLLSLELMFTTLGVSWINILFEDFAFITFVSLAFQLISLLLLFLFVKSENDLYIYAAISVFNNIGVNVANRIHLRKYCKIRWIPKCNFKKHFKPIMIIFSTNIAVTIYVNSDITALGIITDSYYVGLYSVSVKIYTIIKNVFAAMISVTIPRFASLIENRSNTIYYQLLSDMYHGIALFIFPATTGLIALSKTIITVIAGEEYSKAYISLNWLGLTLIFCIYAYLFGYCILIPYRKEGVILIATIISAVINFIFNIIFIPIFSLNGAAFATLLSEAISMILLMYNARMILSKTINIYECIKPIIGCGFVWFACKFVQLYIENAYIYLFTAISISIVVYFLSQVILKNKIIIFAIQNSRNKE